MQPPYPHDGVISMSYSEAGVRCERIDPDDGSQCNQRIHNLVAVRPLGGGKAQVWGTTCSGVTPTQYKAEMRRQGNEERRDAKILGGLKRWSWDAHVRFERFRAHGGHPGLLAGALLVEAKRSRMPIPEMAAIVKGWDRTEADPEDVIAGRRMIARYDGRCARCSAEIVGNETPIIYNREAGGAFCVHHGGPQPEDPCPS
jgi:hypothetical protein